jgi:hypothetical protein
MSKREGRLEERIRRRRTKRSRIHIHEKPHNGKQK